MWDIPDYLIVLGCKQSKKHDTVVKVLKDYFEGMLHTQYTAYKIDCMGCYYVLPRNRIVVRVIAKLCDYLAYTKHIDLISHSLYIYNMDYYPDCHRYDVKLTTYFTDNLPPFLKFRLSIGEKLKLLSEIP